MDDKYLILSDIHGNVSAFDAVLKDCEDDIFTSVIILGDCIDYGMRSNEIIRKIVTLSEGLWRGKIIVNIWGNHEKLMIDKDLDRLSTDRGRVMAQYTANHLIPFSLEYINNSMNKNGFEEFRLKEFKALAVHGSLEDNYWKAITPDNLRGTYSDYSFVFSGHSHYSHCFSQFYDTDDRIMRNKKVVTFINPGSVGQPRNGNPYAQYAVLNLPSKRVELRTVEYDVEYEQSLYPDEIDKFYKMRLMRGI